MAQSFGAGGFRKRKSDNTKIVFFAAFAGIGFVLLLASLFLGESQQPQIEAKVQKAPEVESVNVLIPIRQIETGEPLEPTLFRTEKKLRDTIGQKTATDFESVRGMFARIQIPAEQPLSLDLVTPIRPTNAITANIPEGFRAVTIRVDATSSVEGWARAGANVDVVWASQIRGKQAVTVIVQNAKILSAERQVDVNNPAPNAPVPSTVTLLVTADDSAKIQLAQTTGSLSLSLRGDEDPGKGSGSGSITVDDLLGDKNQNIIEDNKEGIVRIGDEEFYLQKGKLIPKKGKE